MMEAVAPLNNEPTTSIQYSAFGYVLGHLKLDASNPKMGKLLLSDETILPVYLFHQSKLDQISLEKLYAWRIYFRTDPEHNLSGLKLVEAIEVKDETKLNKLLPSFAEIDHFRIRGRIQNIWKGQISLRLERNNIPPGKENLAQWKPFYITVLGKLEPRVNKGDAWEVVARRQGMQLHLVEANPIDETACDSKRDKKRLKDESKTQTTYKAESTPPINQDTLETTLNTTPLTSSEAGVIMINGKTPEVTIKFSEHPNVPETGKKVTLQITGDNGIVVRVEVDRKKLQKNVEKMDSYEASIAAMSGKIVKIDPDGTIELEGAGINVFERKIKNKEDSGDGATPQAQA